MTVAPTAGWHVALSVPGGLTGRSGGTLYDFHLARALGELGVRVDELPFGVRRFPRLSARYLAMLAENLRPPPEPPCRVWLQDELGHPGFLFRQSRRWRAAARAIPTSPLRVALVHNLRSSHGERDSHDHARHRDLLSRAPARDAARLCVATLERTYLARVGAWVAVCRDTLAQMRSLVGEHPSPPSLVLYAGKDHAAASSAAGAAAAAAATSASPTRSSRELRLLSVATVAPHKGAHRLLEVLAATPALSEATLTFVGSCASAPSYVNELFASCRTHGLTARVHFRGALEGEALWDAYRAADVFVLPSDREALPLTGIEAFGFGLPVLLTSHGGTNELVTHGRDGLLLPPRDRRAWAEALTSLARDPALRARLGAAAVARHAQLPRWRDAAATLLAFLEDLGTA